MSKKMFTQGPWEAIKTYPYEKSSITICAGNTPIRHIARVLYHDAQTIKDAHLIAAAPDLLAALESLYGYARGLNAKLPPESAEYLKAARAAIAKAKGGV